MELNRNVPALGSLSKSLATAERQCVALLLLVAVDLQDTHHKNVVVNSRPSILPIQIRSSYLYSQGLLDR